MQLRFFAIVFGCLVVTGSGAWAQANPVVERIKAFTQAYNAKDAQAVASFYLKNGALLPPRSKAIVGHKAIAAHYARAFQNGVGALKYRVIEIDQVGPAAAVEIGETQIRVKNAVILGRSVHVWKKARGTWWLARDMYHVLQVKK